MVRFITVLLSTTAIACSAPSHLVGGHNSLAGCWIGGGLQPAAGQGAPWRMNRKGDGSFTIEFKSDDGKIRLEEGTWKQVGKGYTTLTERVDGVQADTSNSYYTDTYEVLSTEAGGVVEVPPHKDKHQFSSTKCRLPEERFLAFPSRGPGACIGFVAVHPPVHDRSLNQAPHCSVASSTASLVHALGNGSVRL